MSYTGCEKTWRKLKCLLLSERIQSEKVKYCIVPIICHFGKSKNLEDSKKNNQQLPRAGDQRRDKYVEYRGFGGNENTLMMGTCYYTFVKNHRMHNTKSKI